MTPDPHDISRRKLLGAMGTIGGAATLGGASTMAFFSDEEEFTNNRLVAGELDLKVDWEEHYSDWSDDEVNGLELEPVMDLSEIPTGNPGGLSPDPTDPDNWVGFPPGFGDLLYVWVGDVAQFMENTAIDAHPDSDGDGVQDIIKTRQQIRTDNPFLSEGAIERRFRDQFADVPDALADRRPLIDLADLKPGDFGEVTFSVHLFDNPGYLWLNGGLVDASEGEPSEPERKDRDELDGVVELLDEIQVALWHDDGNNVFTDPEYVVHRKPVEGPDSDENVELSRDEALIARGTLRELLDELSGENGIPLDADPRSDERDCFPNSTTRFLGFAWWLPVDHANEIQTDSVSFDLGFYTEQCRHNDGSGMPRESSVTVSSTATTADTIARHQVEISVEEDLSGTTLNELTVDYPSAGNFELGNVDPAKSGLSLDYEDGAGIPPGPIEGVTHPDSTGLTLQFGQPTIDLDHEDLDAVVVEYGEVENAEVAGTYQVEVRINDTTVDSDSMEIT